MTGVQTAKTSTTETWMISYRGREIGPLSLAKVREALATRSDRASVMVRRYDDKSFVPAGTIPELMVAVEGAPATNRTPETSQRTRPSPLAQFAAGASASSPTLDRVFDEWRNRSPQRQALQPSGAADDGATTHDSSLSDVAGVAAPMSAVTERSEPAGKVASEVVNGGSAASLDELLVSAAGGVAVAQNDWGGRYEDGTGVVQNFLVAHMWYNLAASGGLKDAAARRDAISARMSADQIADAQKAALAWVGDRKTHKNPDSSSTQAPTGPAPTDPAPTYPTPTDPAPSDPAPSFAIARVADRRGLALGFLWLFLALGSIIAIGSYFTPNHFNGFNSGALDCADAGAQDIVIGYAINQQLGVNYDGGTKAYYSLSGTAVDRATIYKDFEPSMQNIRTRRTDDSVKKVYCTADVILAVHVDDAMAAGIMGVGGVLPDIVENNIAHPPSYGAPDPASPGFIDRKQAPTNYAMQFTSAGSLYVTNE